MTKRKQPVRRTTKKTKSHATKRKVNRTNVILIVGIIIILIPCIIFGWILLSAYLDTGTPIIGDRYENDLNPAITSENINAINNNVKAIPNVENVSVELATATLRVYVDVTDTLSQDEMNNIADQAYNSVTSVLDPNTYFTQHDGEKMYDVEIHVYNLSTDRESDSFIYLIKLKTSKMEQPNTQVVSQAIDEALAQQLRDDVENRKNPTPTPDDTGDVTVGGQDNEEAAPTEETEATE